MNIIITDLVPQKYAAAILETFDLHERECEIDDTTALETWYLINAKITSIGDRVVVLENCNNPGHNSIFMHRPDFVTMKII